MTEVDLVTGSHGFIGEALVAHLEEQGKKVIRVDRTMTIPERISPGVVFHLASYGNLYSQTGHGKIFEVNVSKTNDLLTQLDEHGCGHLVYFSSSSVYGTQNRALNEHCPLLGDSDYARAKITAEKMVMEASRRYPVTIVRPFSVTGVGEQESHLIPTLISSFAKGADEVVLEENPVHDFVDVEDVLSALDVVLEHRKNDPSGWMVYNIGTGIQYTNLEVLGIVEKVMGKKIPYSKIKNLRPYDTSVSWKADCSRLRRLGWEPKKSLEESIQEMVKKYGDKGDQQNYS